MWILLVCTVIVCRVSAQQNESAAFRITFISSSATCIGCGNVAISDVIKFVRAKYTDYNVTFGLHVADESGKSALSMAEKLKLPLVDTLQQSMVSAVAGLRWPAMIVEMPGGMVRIFDDLQRRPPGSIKKEIDATFLQYADLRKVGFPTVSLSCVDSLSVRNLQCVNDSILLIFDYIRNAAFHVNVSRNFIESEVSVPDQVRYEFRADADDSRWKNLVDGGYNPAQAHCAMVQPNSPECTVFSIGQITGYRCDTTMMASEDGLMDTTVHIRWMSRPARFISCEPQRTKTARTRASRYSLINVSPQIFDGSVVGSAVWYAYGQYGFSIPDSITPVRYIDSAGEHACLTVRQLQVDSNSFDPYNSIYVTALHNRRSIAICSPDNDLFCSYDLVGKRLQKIVPIGELSNRLRRVRFDPSASMNRPDSYSLQQMLIDSMHSSFVVILSHHAPNPQSIHQNKGRMIDTLVFIEYDIDTGAFRNELIIQVSKAYQDKLFSIWPITIRNGGLYALAKAESGMLLIKFPI